jgi:hypothetical protein
MECENDSTEVYPGQDLATANYYLGQTYACQATDKAVMKFESVYNFEPGVSTTMGHHFL